MARVGKRLFMKFGKDKPDKNFSREPFSKPG